MNEELEAVGNTAENPAQDREMIANNKVLIPGKPSSTTAVGISVGIAVLSLLLVISALVSLNHSNTKIAKLQKQVKNLEARQVDLVEDPFTEETREATALLDPSDPGGYNPILTRTGYLLISLEQATSYLDGYKVKLRIGNPNMVRYHGFKVSARWGENLNDVLDPKKLWMKTSSYTDEIMPGSWKTIDFIVSPATVKDMKWFAVTVTVDELSLLQ